MTHHEDTNGKLLTDADAEEFGAVFRDYSESKDAPSSVLIAYGQLFVADRAARIEREEKLYGALLDMWDQFGYDSPHPSAFRGRYEGGLTALENAREALEEYADEHPSLLA
jgi:hypothetical protein